MLAKCCLKNEYITLHQGELSWCQITIVSQVCLLITVGILKPLTWKLFLARKDNGICSFFVEEWQLMMFCCICKTQLIEYILPSHTIVFFGFLQLYCLTTRNRNTHCDTWLNRNCVAMFIAKFVWPSNNNYGGGRILDLVNWNFWWAHLV